MCSREREREAVNVRDDEFKRESGRSTLVWQDAHAMISAKTNIQKLSKNKIKWRCLPANHTVKTLYTKIGHTHTGVEREDRVYFETSKRNENIITDDNWE